jgi:hypothetical protein
LPTAMWRQRRVFWKKPSHTLIRPPLKALFTKRLQAVRSAACPSWSARQKQQSNKRKQFYNKGARLIQVVPLSFAKTSFSPLPLYQEPTFPSASSAHYHLILEPDPFPGIGKKPDDTAGYQTCSPVSSNPSGNRG